MITVDDIKNELKATAAAGGAGLSKEVRGGYASDLLSDVMANAVEGDVWVTLQAHPNIVAVGSLKDLAAIVLVGGRDPAPEAADKANEHELPLLVTEYTAFESVAILSAMGVTGKR